MGICACAQLDMKLLHIVTMMLAKIHKSIRDSSHDGTAGWGGGKEDKRIDMVGLVEETRSFTLGRLALSALLLI